MIRVQGGWQLAVQLAELDAQPGQVGLPARSARSARGGRLTARVVSGRAQGHHCGLVLARGCQYKAGRPQGLDAGP